jgi:hypothetical protein
MVDKKLVGRKFLNIIHICLYPNLPKRKRNIFFLRLGKFFLHSLLNEKGWKLFPSGWAIPTRQKFTSKQRFEKTSRHNPHNQSVASLMLIECVAGFNVANCSFLPRNGFSYS